MRVSPHTAQALQKPVGPAQLAISESVTPTITNLRSTDLQPPTVQRTVKGAPITKGDRLSPSLVKVVLPGFLTAEHLLDVGTLSGRANLEPVSDPLRTGIRFFQHPLPLTQRRTSRLACLMTRRVNGVSTFRFISNSRG